MDKATYQTIESYMRQQMQDSAHDCHHIYRVLHQSLQIARNYPEVNLDVLIAACLLHDIGRQAQFRNPKLCHAVEGGKMAYDFLRGLAWPETDCRHVQDCITTHRYRTDAVPKSLEAKIFFDADKLDVTGALAIARSLIYQGQQNIPLFTLDDAGAVHSGADPSAPGSFFKEYEFKLLPLYGHFFTPEAQAIAQSRKALLVAYHDALLQQVDLSQFPDLLAAVLT